MLLEQEAEELLAQFPDVDFAFAYGSGAVAQGGYDYNKADDLPMLDVILIVDNPYEWHKVNIARNPHHYSPLLPLDAMGVTAVQEKLKARFWFNTYVPAGLSSQPRRQMKYGVIRKSHALEDLQSWSDLYLAGRLHKPVQILKGHEEIEAAMRMNRNSALQTSLLLLPERFHEVDLYMAIASLSYVGDPRMLVGENPKKVENLVTPIVHHYRNLYKREIDDVLETQRVQRLNVFNFVYAQSVDKQTRWQTALRLPGRLKTLLSIRSKERLNILRPPRAASVRAALATIVASAASMQTMKGLFTAGAAKSAVYAWNKISKRFSLPGMSTTQFTAPSQHGK